MTTATQINAARQYQRQAIMTASKEKLVVMLYDGALRFMDRGLHAFESGNTTAIGEALSKAFAVVGELRSTIDHGRGGTIALDLERLYGFIQDRIVLANRDRQTEPLVAAREVMATLKEGWDAIVRTA